MQEAHTFFLQITLLCNHLISSDMKRFLNILGIVLALSIVATSCEKAPFLTLSTPKTINFTDQGGTQSITFTANRDWSVSSSDSWCKVSPSSGNKADGNITVTLTCEQNTTYDPRSATLTLRVEELSETITVTQDTNLGLLVSPTSYDLSNAAQSIEVEVRANVKYAVEIDAACKDWITQTGTKALSTEKITFSIAANESYDSREGKITITQTDGSLSETIVVKQSQTNGLFITTPEYDLSNEEHTLSVEVKANVSFQVSPQVDWIKYVETKALASSTIVLSIEANATYDDRTGTVLVKQTNGDISGTITINQKQTDGLFVTPTDVDVDNAEHTVELEVRNNVSYDVVIPDEAKEWISIKSNTATKALADNKVTLAITPNGTYDNREASITIKQVDGPLAETVKIKQAQTDGLIVGKKEYEVGRDGETIEIRLQTNIEYDAIIPEDAKDWVTRVESAPTKALVNESVYLQIAENPTYYNREASVVIKKKGADLQETVLIKQAQTDTLFISDESKEYKVPSKGGEIIVNVFHNIDFEIDATSIPEWITISKTDVDTYNSKLSLKVNQNTEYIGRDAKLELISGQLKDSFDILQHQVDIVRSETNELSFGWEGGKTTVHIYCNTDYSLSLPEGITMELVESAETSTLSDKTYSLSVSENLDIANETSVIVYWNNEEREESFSIVIKRGAFSINVETPGTLINSVGTERVNKIKGIRIQGQINGTDILIIRRMDLLYYLDIKNAIIVSGGNSYYDNYKTADNVIGYQMFCNRPNLEVVLMPKDVTRIETQAFWQCPNLKTIELPAKLEQIDFWGFSGCSKLTNVMLPNTLKELGSGAFDACSSIKEIVLPESLVSMSTAVFRNTGLKTIILPKNLNSIGSWCFEYCKDLMEVHIKASPSTLVNIASDLFSESTYQNATLFVPKGTKDAYYLTEFGRFTQIIEE